MSRHRNRNCSWSTGGSVRCRSTAGSSNNASSDKNDDDEKKNHLDMNMDASRLDGEKVTDQTNNGTKLMILQTPVHSFQDKMTRKSSTTTGTIVYKSTDEQGNSVWKEYDPGDSSSLITQEMLSDKEQEQKPSSSFSSPLLLGKRLLHHFLPANYPHSVPTPHYARFAGYCFLASTFGSANMVLSTQTLLLGIGVVSSNASVEAPVAAATINWILKDGIGQLGGIWFASYVSGSSGSNKKTSASHENSKMNDSNSLDAYPKQWRMASAFCMDAAAVLELLTPQWGGAYFLMLASVANVFKNVGFLTASASRAALHQSLALQQNLADITAKAGSQSIAASLFGTGLGIAVTPYVLNHGSTTAALGGVFVLFSLLHQGFTYVSVQAVPLATLNRHRLDILLRDYARKVVSRGNHHGIRPMSPAQVASDDLILPLWLHDRLQDDEKKWLEIGTPFLNPCPDGTNHLQSILKRIGTTARTPLSEERYVLWRNERDTKTPSFVPLLRLSFHTNASARDVLRGMLHSHLLYSKILEAGASESPSSPSDIAPTTRIDDHDDFVEVIQASHFTMDSQLFDAFYDEMAKSGWKLEHVSVESKESYRISVVQMDENKQKL